MHSFEVKIEPWMMRQAWNAWFLKGHRMGRIAFACLLLLAAVIFDYRGHGKLGTMSVVCLTVVAFTVIIYLGGYFVGARRVMAKLNTIVEGRASYCLTDDTIEATSSLGSIKLAWPAVAEVRTYGDLTLLGYRGTAYSVIPTAQIPAPALSFLVDRARASGAKIRQP